MKIVQEIGCNLIALWALTFFQLWVATMLFMLYTYIRCSEGNPWNQIGNNWLLNWFCWSALINYLNCSQHIFNLSTSRVRKTTIYHLNLNCIQHIFTLSTASWVRKKTISCSTNGWALFLIQSMVYWNLGGTIWAKIY